MQIVAIFIIAAAAAATTINAKQPQQSDVVEALEYGLSSMKRLYEEKEPQLYAMGLFLTSDNPAHFVATFNQQTAEYKQLARTAYASLEATKRLRKKFSASTTRQAGKESQCPGRRERPVCPRASRKYRTSDGSCNNLGELWWGSALSTMRRFLPAVYEDGVESIRRSAVTGLALPSARRVSDVIHQERDRPLVGSVTHMLMQWGQFVDHDLTATGQSRAFNGSVPQCCLSNGRGLQPAALRHPDCLPIAVPPEDSRLGEKGVRCLEFVRSGPALAEQEPCDLLGRPREQLNQVTSFVDASGIYGSSARQSDALRTFRRGAMQFAASDGQCARGSLSTGCFGAGDGRLTEQPALVSIHNIFVRLHNLLAGGLSALNRHWSDERIFQESRKIVGALVQHITYHEFLPIVLGQKLLKTFDLQLARTPGLYYDGYDPSVNPNIANGFSSAAYRFGHSLVQASFVRFDRRHCPLSTNVSIHEEFANRADLESAGSVERIVLGLINQPAQKRDEFIAEELTNHLFQTPAASFGMDLASLNIQRGRDHGIAPYVEWRRACALKRIRGWADLERVMASAETVDKFKSIYAAVEDIDLFSAGLAEKPLRDGLVGPTFACIIAQQFRNLRRGDRFWYENPFAESRFSIDQLAEIRLSTLAKIICATLAEGIDDIQPFVMLSVDLLNNQRLPCQHPSLRFIDLEPWREEKQPVLEQRARKPAEKPNKTRINQQNRVTIKRPLGSAHENLTIVINNNAVYSPVYIKDSIYGSHQNVVIATTAEPSLSAAADQPKPTEPYYPHNFGDQYCPDYPRYSRLPDSTVEWLSKLLGDSKRSAETHRDDNLDGQKSSNSEARLHNKDHTAETNQDWDSELPKPIDETMTTTTTTTTTTSR